MMFEDLYVGRKFSLSSCLEGLFRNLVGQRYRSGVNSPRVIWQSNLTLVSSSLVISLVMKYILKRELFFFLPNSVTVPSWPSCVITVYN